MNSKKLFVEEGGRQTVAKTGAVLHTDTWSETQVSGSGGGSYVGAGGHVSSGSVSISSKVTERHRFFINDLSSDREFEIDLSGMGCAVRPGQKVTALWMKSGKQAPNNLIGLHNYNTESTNIFDENLKEHYPASVSFSNLLIVFSGFLAAVSLFLLMESYLPSELAQTARGYGVGEVIGVTIMVALAIIAFAPIILASRRSRRRGQAIRSIRDSIVQEFHEVIVRES